MTSQRHRTMLCAAAFVGGCGGGKAAPATDAGPTTLFEGTLDLREVLDPTTVHTISTASFTMASFVVTHESFGPCVFDQRMEIGQPTSESAGTITITGASGGDVTMTDRNGSYTDVFQGLRYQAGDALAIAASGDVVPAFNGTLAFPVDLHVSDPPQVLVLPQSDDLTVHWAPVADPVRILMGRPIDAVGPTTAECVFDGGAGMGTVPKDVFAAFGDGDITLQVIASETLDAMAGDYAVRVLAFHDLYNFTPVIQG